MNIKQVLLNIGAAKKVKNKIKLTGAGILFFTRDPQRFFPAARVRCARFEDKSMRNFIDQATYEGSITEMMDRAVRFVERNIRLAGTRELGVRRIDRLEYPLSVIREAIINAMVHRDYFSPADVRVAIFDDMIRIFNAGTFPEGFDIKNPTHVPRNRILCNLLYDVGYIEKWGSGIPMMRQEMVKWGLREPEFEDKKLEIVTILHGAGEEVVETIAISEKYGDTLLELNRRQREVLKYMERNPRITNREYREMFNIHKDTAHEDLTKLCSQNLLIRKGGGRSTYYILNPTNIRRISDEKND